MAILACLLGLVLGSVIGAAVAMRRLRARHDADLQRVRAAAQSELAESISRATAEAEARLTQAESMNLARQDATVAQLLQHESELRASTESELAAARASEAALTHALEEARRQYRELVEQQRREQAVRQQEAAAESKVLQHLQPVAEQLRAMQEKVALIEEQRATQQGELAEQIRATQESARHSRDAASALASALQNNQIRGGWGETQLRTLVESAGLQNRVDFFEQATSTNEDGVTIKPDMVIHLPGEKFLAIDSKVPYAAFMEAQRDDLTAEQRARLLTDHAAAVRGHVKALAARKYPTGLDGASLDFTIAFIPSDPILDAALKADPSLMEEAFRHGVVLASPASAWAILKTVAFTWRQDVLTDEARHLFDLGRELYGRVITMATHVESMGKTLTTTVNHYNKFVSSLQRNVLTSAQRFEKLDESKVFPAVPEIEAQAESLSKGVFVAELAAAEQAAALADLNRPEFPDGIDGVVDAELIDDADAV